jgi:hypothetical protein
LSIRRAAKWGKSLNSAVLRSRALVDVAMLALLKPKSRG